MRRIFLIIIFIVSSNYISAQHNHGGLRHENINYFTKVAPPSIYQDRIALNKTSTASFTPTFINSPNEEAKTALQEALNIWSYLLASPGNEIKVKVEWKSIADDGNGKILASAAPEGYYATTANNTRYFPVALAESLENQNLNGTNYDILIEINTDTGINWYYGLDGNTPVDKTDFLSTVLHEMAHGLGFADSYSYNETTLIGSTQYNFFDEMIVNGSGAAASSLLSLANNSTALGSELISDDLYIMGQRTSAIANGVNPKIYAPTTWVNGTSIAHLDEEAYKANDNNSLMTPTLGMAEAIHSPGEITLSVLEDMGWNVGDLITLNEPNASSYWVKGSTYQIQWSGNHEISINIDVYKKDSNGDYVDYDQIEDSYTSIPGENSPYTWNIPSSYPAGEYKIKMLDETIGYGLSESFHITATASGGSENTVFFQQHDGQNLIGEIEIWPQYTNFWEVKSYSSTEDLLVGSGFSIRSRPGFVTGTTKRFSHMAESYPDVPLVNKYINHSDYIVREDEMAQDKYQNIHLYVKNASNTAITSNIEGMDDIGSIGFKDPWFYDETTDPKGDRNRGLYPIWYYNSTLNLSTTSSYQGVFLEQGYNQQTNEWIPPYYTVVNATPATMYLQGKNRNFYFQNWEADPVGSATFQNSNNLETPVVFNQANATVKAVMKGIQLSNTSGSFNNNHQNKLIRVDGVLYKVYDSMNRLWLERSSDNGSTWEIMNGGTPIDTIAGGKYPSLAKVEYDGSETFVIVYNLGGSNGELRLQLWSDEEKEFDVEVPSGSLIPYVEASTSPVVSFNCYGYNGYNNRNGRIIVAWQFDGYVLYQLGCLANSTITWLADPVYINSSDAESVTISKNSSTEFHLAWAEDWSDIKYCKLSLSGSNTDVVTISDAATVSTGAPYPENYEPHITVNTSGYPVVVWSSRIYYGSSPKVIRRTKSSSGWSSSLGQYGSGTLYPKINMGGSTYVVSWAEVGGAIKHVKPWGSVITFSQSGEAIQLANSSSLNTLYGSIINRTSLPNYFTTTQSIGSLSKVSSGSFNQGRGVVARIDTTQFFFIMGDISVNSENIGFNFLPDTMVINKEKELEDFLVTQPFQFSNSDELMVSLYLGVSDSVSANSIINKNNKINFTFELIEDGTNKVLGIYENFVHKKDSVICEKTKLFKIDGEGIGNKIVRLRMVLDTNIEGEYTLLDVWNNEEVLGKVFDSNVESISFGEELVINDYALLPNYPNPFNPSTQISYQLPTNGFVSLKVYDIKGSEVKTLVSKAQPMGKYTVNFDASSLSSGVYFYKLTCGSFAKSMKMLLIK